MSNEDEDIQRPAVAKMATNLVRTMAAVAREGLQGGEMGVSKIEKDRRLAICKACEFLDAGRCMKCGCFMSFKAYFQAATCPLGRWDENAHQPGEPHDRSGDEDER